MGYHLKKIEKGQLGKASKIREEFLEFEDAVDQGNIPMAILELCDMLGAIEAHVAQFNLTLNDLIKMKDATARAFADGTRK